MSHDSPLTLRLSPSELERLIHHYEKDKVQAKAPYVIFQAKGRDYAVTAYILKKGFHSIVFQGEKAVRERNRWGEGVEAKRKAIGEPASNLYPQIGSDEVGTGDFFGPLVVVASYVEKKDLPYLKELGVQDSKAMTDEKILEIAPLLVKRFPYSCLVVSPAKYNDVHDQRNMNKIKAELHNKALLNLKRKYPDAKAYQDQFAPGSLYYNYLKELREEDVLRGIVFKAKGETHFPSVALSSVLARYRFLLAIREMGEEYGVSFPLGAGARVDSFLAEFMETHNEKDLREVAKVSFKNYSRWRAEGK